MWEQREQENDVLYGEVVSKGRKRGRTSAPGRGMNVLTVLILVGAFLIGAAAGLVGGPSDEERLAELAGTWTLLETATGDEKAALLENIDFFQEEIELAEDSTFDFVATFTVDGEMNYSMGYDTEATRRNVRVYFEDVFEVLYQSREALEEVYGEDFSAMSQEKFRAFYASVYEYESLEELISALVESSFDYAGMETYERGTFTFIPGGIRCEAEEEDQSGTLEYEIEDDRLTLTYADGVEVYTRK